MDVGSSRATSFLLRALAWSLGLFALLRGAVVERWLVLPLTGLQARAADFYSGRPSVPVSVTLDCSGADVLALCLGAILACPVPWRSRLKGAAGGVALVLALNTLRIATLGHAAASPGLFRILHLQVWPALLVLASAAYVFTWMGAALRPAAREPLLGRFLPRAGLLLVAFALCSPWLMRNEALLAAGAATARASAFLLSAAGLAASAAGNVLTTSRGSFRVTAECLATPLAPLYVAGVLAARWSWRRRALALAMAPALFGSLAIARLLLLALPPALAASPLFLVHGFHQFVLAALCVVAFGLWRQAAARASLALAAGLGLAVVGGSALAGALLAAARAVAALIPHTLTELAAPGDAQGALALLPAFQAGLLLAFGLTARASGRRMGAAFAALLVSQMLFLVGMGELRHAGFEAHALLLRAWAIGVPVVLTWWLLLEPEALAAPPLASAEGAALR